MDQKLLKLTAFLLILIAAFASSCQPEEPKEIEYTISPASLNFDATGGEGGFTVSVKSPAIVESVESLAAWCQVSMNGVSPVNVIVKVDSNHTTEARNTFVVVNMKLEKTKASVPVQITQEPEKPPTEVWKYTNERDGVIIVLTFCPDENKLHIKSTPEQLSPNYMLGGNKATEYRMEGNIMYLPDHNGNFDEPWKDQFSWLITYPSENEMILNYRGVYVGIKITRYYFIRQIN